MAKITYREIAKLAGVSLASVSFAIKNKAGVSEETRQKILKVAHQHGYFDNNLPIQAIMKRPLRIASIFSTAAPEEDQLFYEELNSALLRACNALNYWLVPTSITERFGQVSLPQCIRDIEVDGVLIFGDLDQNIYEELDRLGIPFVIVDSYSPSSYPSVSNDYEEVAYEVTQHLIGLGHEKIAFLSNASSQDFNMQTLRGFHRAMEGARLHVPENWIQLNTGDVEAVNQCLERILSGSQKPSAIFSTVDFYSFKLIQQLHLLGYRIPEDISIVSIDDVVVARLISPPLTTIHVEREMMVQKGLEMLTKRLNCESCQSVVLPIPKLAIRGTTAPPQK